MCLGESEVGNGIDGPGVVALVRWVVGYEIGAGVGTTLG